MAYFLFCRWATGRATSRVALTVPGSIPTVLTFSRRLLASNERIEPKLLQQIRDTALAHNAPVGVDQHAIGEHSGWVASDVSAQRVSGDSLGGKESRIAELLVADDLLDLLGRSSE